MITEFKTALLCVFLISLFSPANAQEDPRQTEGTYWTLGIGIPITTVRDKANTPLAYRGMHFRVFTTFERIKKEQIFRTQLSFNTGSLKPYIKGKRSRATKTSLSEIQISTSYYRKVGGSSDNTFGQFLGGGLNFLLNTRSYRLPSNNTTGFLGSLALQVNFMDRREAFDKDTWSATSTISMPVFARIFRPTYIGLPKMFNEQKPGFKSVMREMQWVTVNKFFYINASFDFDHQVEDWRTQRYGYLWNMLHTSLPTYKPLTSVTGGLTYGSRFLK